MNIKDNEVRIHLENVLWSSCFLICPQGTWQSVWTGSYKLAV